MDDRNSTNDTTNNNTGDKIDTGTHGASYMGADNAPDTNTNLDSTVPGGPQTGADRAAAGDVTDQHAQQSLADGMAATPDPARQTDNSGMLQPGLTTRDEAADGADVIGQSGNDRQGDR
ncbi:hypothetical protein QOL99_05960 [Deinococcus sp. MIMF12]|uniref:Uncharacterized protein n=1 Tax=Deinococcus rhizophilus TaxID=3049544 RepID=A0ABT7JF63_9DEIO|nr:hypothetical protein [Deinococcus rhizophilus]MDL2343695.1 hypothetical protein [Deinococcus rhizophilus]